MKKKQLREDYGINIAKCFILLSILNAIVFFISVVCFNNETLITSQFIGVSYYSFSDFFDSIFFATRENPYDFGAYGAIYPPFCYLLGKVLASFIPNAEIYVNFEDTFVMRDSQMGRMLYLMFMSVMVLIIAASVLEMSKKSSRFKILNVAVIIMCTPLISVFDRGNFIILAIAFSFIFVTFYDSSNKVLREIALISLAIAASVKIYPAVLGVLLLKHKNIKVIIRTVIYGVLIFVLPCFAFDGIPTLIQFFKNLMGGVSVTQLYEGSINGQVDFGTVCTTIVRLFNHNIAPESYATIGTFAKYISYILAVQLLLGSLLFEDTWKKVLCLSGVMLVIPPFSFAYCIASYLPAVALFITGKHKNRRDLIYVIPLFLLITPFCIDLSPVFERMLGIGVRYSVVLENFSQAMIFIILVVDILIEEIKFLKTEGLMGIIRWFWGFIVDVLDLGREILAKFFRIQFEDEKWKALVQFVKFGFVGLSNTVISTVIYWIMIYFGINKYVASVTGFVVSVLNSFFWNNSFVFKKEEGETRSPIMALIKTFASYAATGLVLHNILLYVWTEIFSVNDYLVPIINLVITIPINFVMNKFWAFKTKKKEEKNEKAS